jgi:VIT1/CCC1 family predicted Fe2+/Mn2+ transporter
MAVIVAFLGMETLGMQCFTSLRRGFHCWRRLAVTASVPGMSQDLYPTREQSEIAVATHSSEPHGTGLSGRLNWLRAGVLGANDGIVSVAGIVVGVAAATAERGPILTAGVAGLAAGAVSMALGEYVSVSTQRDSERALLEKERTELAEQPEEELAELAAIYRAKGLSPATALTVAEELTARDAFTAHAEAELGIDPDDLTNPWHAAFSSAVSFTVGALLPLLAILVVSQPLRVPVTVATVLVALAATGAVGARFGGAATAPATARVVLGGALAMATTYLIGHVVGIAV